MDHELMDLVARLVRIKDTADGRLPLVSNQGQAMDGYTELAEYRAVVKKIQDVLARRGSASHT